MPTGLGDEVAWICPTIQNDLTDIANSNDATLYNGVVVSQTEKGGLEAISFDATNEYLQIDGLDFGPSVITDSLFPISKAFWIKINDWNFEWKTITGQRSGQYRSYWLRVYGDLHAQARKVVWEMSFYTPSNRRAGATIDCSLTSEWHHVAWTKQQGVRPNTDGSVKFYLDGQFKNIDTVTINNYNTNETYSQRDYVTVNKVAVGTTSNQYFNGYVDDYRFFHRELEQEEISHLATSRGVLGGPGGTHVHRTLLGVG